MVLTPGQAPNPSFAANREELTLKQIKKNMTIFCNSSRLDKEIPLRKINS